MIEELEIQAPYFTDKMGNVCITTLWHICVTITAAENKQWIFFHIISYTEKIY
jgi:hypothetical protein